MAPITRDKNDCRATQNDSKDGSSSYFQKTVCLHDWWLVKSDKEFEGRRLAIAGSTSIESKAFRLFTSAPIVKRNDVITLQTADEICVYIRGFINKQRTLDNGFSSEVFNHFYFGFPPYWEKYAKEHLGEVFTNDNEVEVVPDSRNAARDSCFDPTLILTPSSHAVNLSTMVEEGSNLDNSQKREQNPDRNTPLSLPSKLNHVKEYSPVKETRKELDFEEAASHVSGERIGKRSIISPESLNLKRSRSGRVPLPRNHAFNLSSMVEERSNHDNSRKKDKASTMKVQEEQNPDGNTPSSLPSKLNHVKEYSPGKETRKELYLEKTATPVSKEGIRKQTIISPESLKLKRSRSGRVLLPRMEFWRNQIPVYDQDRRITGIKEEEVDDVKLSGSRSISKRKKR